MVVPDGKLAPLVCDDVSVTPGQLSKAVGRVHVTVAPHWPAVLPTVMFCGQPFTTGTCVSFTVTVNEQLSALPAASVAM